MFESFLNEIAAAYDRAPEYSTAPGIAALQLPPHVLQGWAELATDAEDRAATIRLLLDVSVTDDPEPYPDAAAMCEDIACGRFIVSDAHSEHPIWTVSQNVDFRIVHDVLGHYAASVALGYDLDRQAHAAQGRREVPDSVFSVAGFDWRGENLACAAHVRLLGDPLARMALFTECIAQTGYAIARGGFGPQKVADLGMLLPHTVRDGLRCAYRNWLEGVE